MRDQTISHAGKMRVHCKGKGDESAAIRESAKAREIMGEALDKYGKRDRFERNGEPARALAVSYEGLMSLKDEYLLDVYRSLGIHSTYMPEFQDGNEKYVNNAVMH